MVASHHYSGRCPGAKYAYGMYEGADLVGCAVYSTPASYTLCAGVCGPDYKDRVIELSRLVVTTKRRNAASVLVGRSLAALPDHVVVSYADCNEHIGHIGYVYQATNWLYTGQGSAESYYVHPDTHVVVSYTRRWIEVKAARFGIDPTALIRIKQVGKHRYVYFTGNRRFTKAAQKSLRYPVLPYPKGETARHDAQVLFRLDGPEIRDDTPPAPTRLR